jgi:hypothetical protein
MLNSLSLHPFAVLYGLQAVTYGLSAIFSSRGDHRKLTECYLASALLHGLFCACHCTNLG